ncbi:hypothetical protein TRFO_24407 [Tritrichomonas foetus]|uniref:Uncharacterized protein n=1 Tax=Tritrichomonas foetus TaxID=1144522 RepID=A0A1J4K929_9EUKA|nr:hypothetical protein TRFO_24407 [Tritrichomonas foetus]|eukprot:OHT07392.1 hypothetical protein TRFO_24407 [Tritrichomonas foetus]
MYFVTLFFFRHFLIQPLYISNESTIKVICRGWTCGNSKNNLTQNDNFIQIIRDYKENILNMSLSTALDKFLLDGFIPAISAAGLFHLFEIDDFSYNPQKSLELLKKCASDGYWACHEHLAFHPLITNPSEQDFHLHEGAKLGSVSSMYTIALNCIENEKYEEANNYLFHLLYAISGNWFQKRRAGLEYADDVKSILLNNNKSLHSWRDLKKKAKSGHLPAALWIFDGLRTGRFNEISAKEMAFLASNYVENGLLKTDALSALNSKDRFNKKEVMKYLVRMGDKVAEAFLSYPDFF